MWAPLHVLVLATYTPNSAFRVSPFLTDFHSGTTMNYQSTTTFHWQEPAPLSPLLEIASPFLPHSILPHYHPKGTCIFKRPWDPDVPHYMEVRLQQNYLQWISSFNCHLFFLNVSLPAISHIKVHYNSSGPKSCTTPHPIPWKQSQTTHDPVYHLSVNSFLNFNPSEHKSSLVTTTKIHRSPQAIFLISCSNFKSQSQIIFFLHQLAIKNSTHSHPNIFSTVCGRSKESLSIPAITQENLEPILLLRSLD